MSVGRIGIGLVLILSAVAMGLFELETTPPLWWDEGWTLCVARQWVETGHYGCLLNGEAAPPILAGHFPVVASIAAGFRLFGVGVWQARLVELLYAFGALGLLYYLERWMQLFRLPVQRSDDVSPFVPDDASCSESRSQASRFSPIAQGLGVDL